MRNAAWKDLERSTAKALGGTRIGSTFQSGRLAVSQPDIAHPLFSVECKYRAKLPSLLRLGLEQAARYSSTKPPLLVVKERGQKGALVVLRLADFVDLFGTLTPIEEEGL